MFDKLSRKEKLEKMVLLNHLSAISHSIIKRSNFLSKGTLNKLAHTWAELSATIIFDWVDDLHVKEYQEAKEEFDKTFNPDSDFDTSNFNSIID